MADPVAIVGRVHIVLQRPAHGDARADHRGRQPVAQGRHGDLHRAVRAARGCGAQFMPFQRGIGGADMGPVPVLAAQFRDAVEIGGLAAHIHHPVDGGGTTQHPPANPGLRLPGGARLRLAGMRPQVARIGHHLGKPLGHGDERMGVARAGLDQADGHLRVFGQAIGQHAARRARAHDHIVMAGLCNARHALRILPRKRLSLPPYLWAIDNRIPPPCTRAAMPCPKKSIAIR